MSGYGPTPCKTASLRSFDSRMVSGIEYNKILHAVVVLMSRLTLVLVEEQLGCC